MSVRLGVHGLQIAVGGGWDEVVERVRLDFAWFEARDRGGGSRAAVEVVVEEGDPALDRFGEIRAAFVTPRNVVYQDGGHTIVDYFGRAVSVLDRAAGRIEVRGRDAHLVHEAAYLYLLSRIGEHLDAIGLPRLHGLALTGPSEPRGATVVMLPSGGGKSTLALRALRDPAIRILSEDTPLIDARGTIHPFPLRIGINATDAASLPADHVRRIERMEFHPKLVLDLEAFASSIEERPAPLRHIVVGRRSLGRRAELRELPRRAAVGTLLREAVVGVGVYQGMEFVLQRGMRDTLGQAGVAATRARCCAAGLRRARVWELVLGRDHDANWAALAPLLR